MTASESIERTLGRISAELAQVLAFSQAAAENQLKFADRLARIEERIGNAEPRLSHLEQGVEGLRRSDVQDARFEASAEARHEQKLESEAERRAVTAERVSLISLGIAAFATLYQFFRSMSE